MTNKGNKTEELMSIDHTKPYHTRPDPGQPEDPALATEIIHIFTAGAFIPGSSKMGAAAVYTTPDTLTNSVSEDPIIVRSCRPEQTHSSPEKAEKFAIYTVLLESPKASNITIYITSPAVFNDLMKIDSHPTSRTILKITDYQILEAILHQLLLYETTPTFILAPLDDTNSIHPFQKTAAESAEEIRTESEYAQNRLLPFIPTFSKDLHYFQFKSNTRPLRFDAYCRKILKGQEQDRLEALNLTKLNEIWLGNATFTHESYVLSANLTNKGLPKSSPLDATHYKTHALNLKILCRNLQSRETLAGYKTMFITNETCSNCNEKETPQHVFVCTYTQANYHTIYSQTKTYLQEELQIYFQSKKAKNPTLASYPQDYHERILKELNIDSHQFLRDNQAQGVVDIIKINKFKEIGTSSSDDSEDDNVLKLVSGAWARISEE